MDGQELKKFALKISIFQNPRKNDKRATISDMGVKRSGKSSKE